MECSYKGRKEERKGKRRGKEEDSFALGQNV
jgi:hypothetical protein